MSSPWSERDHAGLARELGGLRGADEPTALARLTELVGVVFRLRDEGVAVPTRGELTPNPRTAAEKW